MKESLLIQMKGRLRAVKGQWPSIADQAGVDYVWLTKVMQGAIKDPGVTRVERVIAALDLMGPSPDRPSPSRHAQPSMGQEAAA